MTTKEAIQSMLDGKKVTPVGWTQPIHIYFNGAYFATNDNKQYLFGSLEYDWEIYEEPKPKQIVVIEKWLCSVVEDSYYVIEGTKEFMSGRSEKVKLLDTYEIEL